MRERGHLKLASIMESQSRAFYVPYAFSTIVELPSEYSSFYWNHIFGEIVEYAMIFAERSVSRAVFGEKMAWYRQAERSPVSLPPLYLSCRPEEFARADKATSMLAIAVADSMEFDCSHVPNSRKMRVRFDTMRFDAEHRFLLPPPLLFV